MALIFPALIGHGWSVGKTPMFQTRLRRAQSGRELRIPDHVPSGPADVVNGATAAPLWQFTLTYDFLRGPFGGVSANSPALASGPIAGGGFSEAWQVHALRLQAHGAWAPFFYTDPDDNQVTVGAVGVGDASTTKFQLLRHVVDPAWATPGFYEAVTAPRTVSAIYFDGVPVPGSNWSVNKGSGIVTFATAPPNGAVITADFTYWFRCRFVDDATSFEEFLYLLHTLKELPFITAAGDTTPAPI